MYENKDFFKSKLGFLWEKIETCKNCEKAANLMEKVNFLKMPFCDENLDVLEILSFSNLAEIANVK